MSKALLKKLFTLIHCLLKLYLKHMIHHCSVCLVRFQEHTTDSNKKLCITSTKKDNANSLLHVMSLLISPYKHKAKYVKTKSICLLLTAYTSMHSLDRNVKNTMWNHMEFQFILIGSVYKLDSGGYHNTCCVDALPKQVRYLIQVYH